MNTVGPALPSAVAATAPARQPSPQSNAAASWDAAYGDARAAAESDSDSHSRAPASTAVAAEGGDAKSVKKASAPGQPGNAQSQSASGAVTARQGTSSVSTAAAAQSDGGAGTVPAQALNGAVVSDPTTTAATSADDPSAGATEDPSATGQSSDTDQLTGTSTNASHGKPTNGISRTTNGKISKLPGDPDDMRTNQQDGTDRTAESDNAADQGSSADSSVASGSAKPGQPGSRTDKIASRTAQTRHAPPDAAMANMPSASANPQVALSQSGLVANSSNEADRARKSDDRDSIVLATSATSGTVAPSLTPPPTVHGAVGAQDPDPPGQPLLHHTAADLVTDGGGTARIVLTPPTLGHVEVRVTMAASGAAHIAITAATADGYAALTASHAGLLQHLAQRGVSVGSVQTQLQGNAGQNGTSGGGDGRQRQNQPAAPVPWVKKGQDGTVIAYA